MIQAKFENGYRLCRVQGLTQWDYGQTLEITGLDLPASPQVHFWRQGATEAYTIVGATRDGVTTVSIPDQLLQEYGVIQAYVYLTDIQSGETVRTVYMTVDPRPKPDTYTEPGEVNPFARVVQAVTEQADRASTAAGDAEESVNKACGCAKRAEDIAAEIPGRTEAAKQEIDNYTAEKERELKGETGNVYFASFRVEGGRLKMYSDPAATKIAFRRDGSRLKYRVHTGG